MRLAPDISNLGCKDFCQQQNCVAQNLNIVDTMTFKVLNPDPITVEFFLDRLFQASVARCCNSM